ncbi:MAG: 50S ribosomal protein L3 [Nitrospirae bacterium]|nr:50S ribosomal protein L3 [Nitrospirota bacterium]
MTGIIGIKHGMTRIIAEDGSMVPVTVIEAGPCHVIQVKTQEKDGYEAIRVGFIEERKEKNVTKPMRGVFKKSGAGAFKVVKEIQMSGYKVGDVIKSDVFSKGDIITASGISKGKGFQGCMKRHRFKGGPDTHGSMFNRAPGSIGASSYPSRVWRGIRMAGHMGSRRVSVSHLLIADVRPEQNLILIRGAVPGGKNAVIEIKKV